MRLLRVTVSRFWEEQPLILAMEHRRTVFAEPGLAFFVGPNGTGKSRALEVVGRIFRALSSGISPGMEFALEYELGERRVLVASELDVELAGTRPLEPIGCHVLLADRWDGAWREEHRLTRLPSDPDLWLPRRIVGVASGPTSRLGLALNPRYDAASGRELDGSAVSDDGPAEAFERVADLDQPRCIALAAPELRLATLALLTHPATSASDERRISLLERVGLPFDGGLVAFSFELASDWATVVPEQVGAVELLLKRATRRVDLPMEPLRPGGEPPEPNQLAVFEAGATDGGWMHEIGDDALIWFDRLLSWHRRGAILRTQLVVRKVDGSGLIRSEELSDGEFLMLGRYALLLLLSNRGGSLVLMDEPETHFNDSWKVELIAHLVEVLRTVEETDDVLVATHSDLTLTDADRRNVFVFADHQVSPPGYSTYAADRDEVPAAVRGPASAVGRYSKQEVQRVIDRADKEALRDLLRRAGPGFQRFRVQLAINEEDGAAR